MKLMPRPCASATISRAALASVWSANIIVPRHSVETLSGLLPRWRNCMGRTSACGNRPQYDGGEKDLAHNGAMSPPARTSAEPLQRYRAKRNFAVTPEPSGEAEARAGAQPRLAY